MRIRLRSDQLTSIAWRHQEVSEPPPPRLQSLGGRGLCAPSHHVSSIGQKHRCVGEVCASQGCASPHDFRAMWSAALVADQERSDLERRDDRPGGEAPTPAPLTVCGADQNGRLWGKRRVLFAKRKQTTGENPLVSEFFTLFSGYSSSIVSAVILLCGAAFSSGRLPLPLWPKHSSPALGLYFLWNLRQCPFR